MFIYTQIKFLFMIRSMHITLLCYALE